MSPDHMSPAIRLEFLPVSTSTSDLIFGVADASDKSIATDLQALKSRVEFLAEQYLHGQPLFIQTAALRGPFDNTWHSPWTSLTPSRVRTKRPQRRDPVKTSSFSRHNGRVGQRGKDRHKYSGSSPSQTAWSHPARLHTRNLVSGSSFHDNPLSDKTPRTDLLFNDGESRNPVPDSKTEKELANNRPLVSDCSSCSQNRRTEQPKESCSEDTTFLQSQRCDLNFSASGEQWISASGHGFTALNKLIPNTVTSCRDREHFRLKIHGVEDISSLGRDISLGEMTNRTMWTTAPVSQRSCSECNQTTTKGHKRWPDTAAQRNQCGLGKARKNEKLGHNTMVESADLKTMIDDIEEVPLRRSGVRTGRVQFDTDHTFNNHNKDLAENTVDYWESTSSHTAVTTVQSSREISRMLPTQQESKTQHDQHKKARRPITINDQNSVHLDTTILQKSFEGDLQENEKHASSDLTDPIKDVAKSVLRQGTNLKHYASSQLERFESGEAQVLLQGYDRCSPFKKSCLPCANRDDLDRVPPVAIKRKMTFDTPEIMRPAIKLPLARDNPAKPGQISRSFSGIHEVEIPTYMDIDGSREGAELDMTDASSGGLIEGDCTSRIPSPEKSFAKACSLARATAGTYDGSPPATGWKVIDEQCNTVMSPRSTLNMKKLLRRSAESWESLPDVAEDDVPAYMRCHSLYQSTQAAMQQAYLDFQDVLGCPETNSPQTNFTKADLTSSQNKENPTINITPFRTLIARIAQDVVDDQGVSTQALLEAAPDFTVLSTVKKGGHDSGATTALSEHSPLGYEKQAGITAKHTLIDRTQEPNNNEITSRVPWPVSAAGENSSCDQNAQSDSISGLKMDNLIIQADSVLDGWNVEKELRDSIAV